MSPDDVPVVLADETGVLDASQGAQLDEALASGHVHLETALRG